MDIPPPPMPLLPTKKRKREGDTPETEPVISPFFLICFRVGVDVVVSSCGEWEIP
jgi:hypothetical protein